MKKRADRRSMPVCPFAYVSFLPIQMFCGGIHQFQLLLRGTRQLLDIFQHLLGLELRQLLCKLLLCLL